MKSFLEELTEHQKKMERIANKMAKEAMTETESGMYKWDVHDLEENGITTEEWEDFIDELDFMEEVEFAENDGDGIFVNFFSEYCPNIEE